jgi:hypothetical protein
MSAKLKAATVIAGGALTTLAIPAGNAQAAPPPGPAGLYPGLTAPHPKSAAPPPGSAAHSKAATPDASCGGGVVTWQDNYDNKYLEIYHSGKANGNWADAYAGNGTCTQQWFAVASGYASAGDGYTFDLYGMVNTNSEKCLAAPTTNIGNAHVVQESCGYSHYTYRWAEFSAPGGPGTGGTGWVLSEITSGTDVGQGIAACEDINNHWIYTSYAQIFDNGTGNYTGAWLYPNCVWH